jgi:hypothetical protein
MEYDVVDSEMASRKPAFAHARPSSIHVSLGASSDSISGFGKERHLLHRGHGGSRAGCYATA